MAVGGREGDAGAGDGRTSRVGHAHGDGIGKGRALARRLSVARRHLQGRGRLRDRDDGRGGQALKRRREDRRPVPDGGDHAACRNGEDGRVAARPCRRTGEARAVLVDDRRPKHGRVADRRQARRSGLDGQRLGARRIGIGGPVSARREADRRQRCRPANAGKPSAPQPVASGELSPPSVEPVRRGWPFTPEPAARWARRALPRQNRPLLLSGGAVVRPAPPCRRPAGSWLVWPHQRRTSRTIRPVSSTTKIGPEATWAPSGIASPRRIAAAKSKDRPDQVQESAWPGSTG